MLDKQKKGKARAKDIKSKINDFMKSDRNDIKNREKFINWLHSEKLVMTFDFDWNGTPFDKGAIGIGEYDYNSGTLTEIDSTIESSIAFGLDPEEAIKQYEQRQEWNKDIKAQQEAYLNTAEGKRWAKFKESDTWKEWEQQRKERQEKIHKETRPKGIRPKNKYEWFDLVGIKYNKNEYKKRQ